MGELSADVAQAAQTLQLIGAHPHFLPEGKQYLFVVQVELSGMVRSWPPDIIVAPALVHHAQVPRLSRKLNPGLLIGR